MNLSSSKSARLLLRTFIIYFVLSLGLLLLPARWTGPARAMVLYPFTRLQAAFLGVIVPTEEAVGRLGRLWRASDEARALREENARLRAQVVQEAEGRRAAELLLEQLNHVPPELRWRAIPASLAGYDSAALRRTALFNNGSRSGIAPKCPVLWNGAVIGRVESADPWSCRALLIGDRACRLAVRCVRTRVCGSLEGIGGGMAQVKYIKADDDVRVGDVFVTSGVDRVFPPDLLVGECTEASNVAGEAWKYILLKPAFDSSLLEHVTILQLEEQK